MDHHAGVRPKVNPVTARKKPAAGTPRRQNSDVCISDGVSERRKPARGGYTFTSSESVEDHSTTNGLPSIQLCFP